ncbi:MAG: hypothetical protein U5K37_07635 [Natrialbaceae archaeon]|nr:hypothetical protein [Natrialbaceae archaeon]
MAYEIPLVLTGMSVVIFAGSLQMSTIVAAQARTLGFPGISVTIPPWFAGRQSVRVRHFPRGELRRGGTESV